MSSYVYQTHYTGKGLRPWHDRNLHQLIPLRNNTQIISLRALASQISGIDSNPGSRGSLFDACNYELF